MNNAIEIRQVEPGGPYELTGLASRVNYPYAVGPFTEVVLPRAFHRSLSQKPGPDVSLTVNHGVSGSGLPLARTTAGNLRLSESGDGLQVRAELDPEDIDVRAIVPKIRNGSVTEMSMAFRVPKGGDSWNDDMTERRISHVELHRGDVSVVSAGANPGTSVSVRHEDYTLEQRRRLAERSSGRLLRYAWGSTELGTEVPTTVKPCASYVDIAKAHRARLARGRVRGSRDRRLAALGIELRAKYDAKELAALGREGKAFKGPSGWSYPIADADDLHRAIKAVGRGSAQHEKIRVYIMGRARAMRLSSAIPSTWNSNGTLAS